MTSIYGKGYVADIDTSQERVDLTQENGQMREAFEAWVLSHGGSIDRTDGGEYRSAPTECGWDAWQAATERAAKVCEEKEKWLEESFGAYRPLIAKHSCAATRMCAAAIRTNNVRTR